MEKKPFLPIVLGSDENAYGCVRLICEKYQVRPLLVCRRLLIPTMHSKLFDYRVIDHFDRDDVFVPSLLSILKEKSTVYEKLVVVTCSDYYTGLMVKHWLAFQGLVANPFPSASLLERFETKDRFYALCDEFGLDYPKTVIVEPQDRMTACDFLPFDFPIVVKPENSNAYEYLHLHFQEKKKVYFLTSKAEYLHVAAALNVANYHGKLIIQEFIRGGDDAMRVMNCYSGADGKVRVSCLGQPVLEEYEPSMLGNYAAIISRQDEALCQKVSSFLNAIGYRGFSNFDMKYDAATGRYLMFEINPRLGRSSFFVRAAGINMMEEMIEDVVFGRERDFHRGAAGAMWSNVPLRVLRKYVKNPILKKEIKQLSHHCWFTLLCKGDRSVKRVYRITRYYLSHFKKYRKYYFQKEDTPI